jgi:collagenase-like PrtC family protease
VPEVEAFDIVVAVVVAVEASDIVVDTAVAVAGKREAAFLVPEAAEEVMDELEFSMEEVVEHFLFLVEVEPAHFPYL